MQSFSRHLSLQNLNWVVLLFSQFFAKDFDFNEVRAEIGT